MNCQEAEPLIDGYFDGELDLVRNLDIEKHVETCGACARQLKDRQVLRTTLKSADLSYRAPQALRQWAFAQAHRAPEKAELRWWRLQGWLPACAMAATLIALYIGTSGVSRTVTENRLAEDVVSAHVRSLMVTHLTDVASSNQHTVKPWFNGKLDFAPTVRDLTEYSFPLIGGRLDYLANRPVAALVYQRQQHFINLFIWPAPRDGDHALKTLVRRGYNLLTWTHGGMNYWAISDLNSRELQQFAQIVQSQILLP